MSDRRTILITAGAGHIGRTVAGRLLAAGYAVTVLDERESIPRARHVMGRVYQRESVLRALEGVTDILHLEWSGGVREATVEPLEKHERAVDSSIRLLDEARRRGLRFVFSSTCPYLGETAVPLSESAPLNERSIYSVQKRYVEAMVASYGLNYKLPTATLRVFNAYGVGGRPGQIVNQIRRAIETGDPIRVNGDGLQVRDFVHVEDVAAAFVAALEAPNLGGEPINVGTGVGTSMLDLARRMAEIAGRELRFEFHPAMGEEARYLVADVRRASERLGWRPTIDLEEGLTRLLRYAT